MVMAGLIRSANKPVKVLGNGDVSRTLTVKANAFSAQAVAKIEAAGGKTEVI
jgi:large subunit ribosomal protein L15